MATVFDNEIFDYVSPRAGINAYPADVDATGFARAEFIELQNITAFDEHHISHRTMHRRRQLGVQLQLPVLAVNGNEVFRLHQINNQLQLFLARVSAHMHWRRRTILVDHVRFAAEQVINHPVDRLLITWNNA